MGYSEKSCLCIVAQHKIACDVQIVHVGLVENTVANKSLLAVRRLSTRFRGRGRYKEGEGEISACAQMGKIYPSPSLKEKILLKNIDR